MPVSWIALNSIQGLGTVTFNKLLRRYGTPEQVFATSEEQLIADGLLSPATVYKIHQPDLQEKAYNQYKASQQLGCTILTLHNKHYPDFLKEIFAPPPILFVLGNVSVLSKNALAIVGSRSPTTYGKQATKQITRDLLYHRFTIVSGLARGIDTIAHETTLEYGGTTIAVLGCGLDNIYPHSNTALAKRICSSGVLISEFPFSTPPEPSNFPRRNRIISGCSSAVIVVEAGEKSGSLITARYALQQGREVCAVPGPINSPLSRGTFNLIRDGATPVRSGHELAEALSLSPISMLTSQSGHTFSEPDESIFTKEERDLYNTLSDQPMCIDDIAEAHKKPVSDLFVLLLNLELKGLVQQCYGQQFMRCAANEI